MVKVTDQLIVEKKDGVGRITFDNQAKRNALTYEMWQGLPVVLDDFASDSAVRVIVLSGAGGKAFSAGADISQFEKQRSSGDTIAVYDQAVAEATNALVGARKPLIAPVVTVSVSSPMSGKPKARTWSSTCTVRESPSGRVGRLRLSVLSGLPSIALTSRSTARSSN